MFYYEKLVQIYSQRKAEDMTNCMPVLYNMVSHSASLHGTEEWQNISWEKVNRHVKSLQARIVKAVRANRWNLVKVLQGILHRILWCSSSSY